MSLISKIIGRKDQPVRTNEEFWKWFVTKADSFYKVVKEQRNIETEFFNKLSPKLDGLKAGYFFLAGMLDDNTAELIITPDGNVKNIAFVEELVKAAPDISGWRLTAFKPALDIKDVGISMAGYKFNEGNLSFYSNDLPEYPDEIEITVVHDDLNDENRSDIINGSYIFLENYIGEMNLVTIIDNIEFKNRDDADKELIPIGKLKDYIIWREKEFIEKYEGVRKNIEDDTCSILEATLENGRKLIANINTDLLKWNRKASHPWIFVVEIDYDGEMNNGMPDDATFKRLDVLEQELLDQLKDIDGHLYIGRQSADNVREIYFTCKDFRLPSKAGYVLQQKYAETDEIKYDIYKDKYWQSFNRFRTD